MESYGFGRGVSIIAISRSRQSMEEDINRPTLSRAKFSKIEASSRSSLRGRSGELYGGGFRFGGTITGGWSQVPKGKCLNFRYV